MKPGATINPAASVSRFASLRPMRPGWAIAAILPSFTPMSAL